MNDNELLALVELAESERRMVHIEPAATVEALRQKGRLDANHFFALGNCYIASHEPADKTSSAPNFAERMAYFTHRHNPQAAPRRAALIDPRLLRYARNRR